MANDSAHQRFHQIALEAKKRLANAMEEAAGAAGAGEDCSCILDMAHTFAILPLPHEHDGSPPHTHPVPPMGDPFGHVMPLPPELQERLDDLLEESQSSISPEALHDMLHDLQRAVSRAVLALVRAIRDAAPTAAQAGNCSCLLAMARAIDHLLMAQMAGGMVPHDHGEMSPQSPMPGHQH